MTQAFRAAIGCLVIAFAFGLGRAAEPPALADYMALELPKPGHYTLHILSPTLLELVLINAKPPDPAPVSSWDFIDANRQFQAPALSEFAVTANGQPIAVQAVGFKRRPLYAPLAKRDLRIDNRLVLQLGSPIADGQVVEVKNPSGTLWPMTTQFSATADPLRYSPAIHVNQEGYGPAHPKKAMVGYYLGSLREMNISAALGFRLVDANTGVQVHQGTLAIRPDVGFTYTPTPYQNVLEANFSGFTTPGDYRLVVPGLGASLPFRIHDGIAMTFVRAYALGLYHQRCGTNNALPFTRFTHGPCHAATVDIPVPQASFPYAWNIIADVTANYASNPRHTAPRLQNEASQRYPFVNRGKIDVSRGHHDAGDYSKYTINSAALVHYLVFAVDAFPGVAALDNLGLPESGDGTSDVMQLAKWETDFLAKLQDADGGFYFLVYPRDRAYEYDVLPDPGDPQIVWPKNTAATAAAVAALAQTASSPRFKQRYPAEAAAYLHKAQLGWNFLTNAIARFGKDGAYQKLNHYGDDFMHDDELAWAACEMFLATTNAAYQTKLIEWFDPASAATRRYGWDRLFASYGCAVRSYAFAARTGRLIPSQLNAAYLSKCETQILAGGQDARQRAQNNAYGTSFPSETKWVRDASWYFSSDRAFDITVAYQMDPRADSLDAILSNLNYEAGCNPVNVSYITGLGWKRQREMVLQYALNDKRVLPPSGLPLGNLQSDFTYINQYKDELAELCFPTDDAATAPYPIYDRWSDSYNLTTEFVHPNQARSLASLAYLATLTSTKTQAWVSAAGQIVVSPEVPINLPVTARFQAPGFNLAGARVVWEAREQEPAFGTNYTFVPTNRVTYWIEAEATWPDGRRIVATTNIFATNGPPAVSVMATDPIASEVGGDAGVFTFSRSSSNVALTVFFTTGGSASNGVHYAAVGHSITFPVGAATRTLTVNPINNGLTEGNKTVVLTLATNAAYAIAVPSSATMVIYDDELNLLPVVAITQPGADIVYLANTNLLLTLEATATDDGKPNPPGVLTTTWNRVSGFGAVTFGSGNVPNTTAKFSASGIYVLRLTGHDGQYQTQDEITVVVDPDNAVTAGLQGSWRFDETSGVSAADSSGNNRPAAVSGGARWTGGKVNNALDFDGMDDAASFNSPAMIQTTIAAWIYADGRGDSFTPRVVEMPAYNIRVRRDAGGNNLAFETERSILSGEWRTDYNTLSDGAWYHLAAAYDSSSPANVPEIYINGIRQNLTNVSTGSGSQLSNAGMGYIANSSARDRSFDGRMDEVRVYNRVLSPAEIQLLSHVVISNLAPVVSAGLDRRVTTNLVALVGSVTDDGQPNPPGALAANWSKVSGPGMVSFGNSNSPATTATFSAVGVYGLRLSATDSEVKVSNDITITVANILKISSVTAAGSAVTLTWASTPGKFYRVSFKDDLAELTWIDGSGEVGASAVSRSWTDTTLGTNRQRFYRVLEVR